MTDLQIKQFMETFSLLTRFDCIPAINEMFKKMIQEDWETESVDTNKTMIVLFLRANFQIKDMISSYNVFLEKSLKYLEKKDINSVSLLKGIV